MNLPPVTRSLRFRLSGMTSAVVFGVAGLALGGVYIVTLRAVQSLTVTEVVAGRPVLLGGEQFAVPFTQVEIRSFESLLKEALLNHMAYWILLILLVLFLLSLVVGWIVANRSLKPLDKMTLVAQDIQATDLDRRINHEGPDDELTRMASTFDAMLDRLAGSFQSQQRFLAQTSHDLRTPLAVIRSNLDVTATDPDADVEEWRETGEIVGRAVDRMSSMVDELLAAARLEMAGYALAPGDLNAVVEEVVDELAATAAESGITLVADSPKQPVLVEFDRDVLRRAINNLVANAVASSSSSTTVTITSRSLGSWRYVGVIDQGSGVDRETIVTGNGGSTGIGLGIVRQIVAMHGGRLDAADNPGGGTIVSIALPVTADPDDPPVQTDGLPELYRG